MPLKIGNVKQSKVANITAGVNGQNMFTLPANAQITNVRAFGTVGTGSISLYARPIGSATPVIFATVDATATATGATGALQGAVPYNRVSTPVVISADGATTGGPVAVEVEYM